MNPNVNFMREFLFGSVGGISVYALTKLLKQRKDLALVLGLVPAATPFAAAINNLAGIVWAQRNYYPWAEFPLFYLEELV